MDESRRETALAALHAYLTTPLDDLLRGAPEDAALATFRAAAAGVPAYASFLREHGIDAAGVLTLADFERLPLTTRDGYVHRYALAERCLGGRLVAGDMVAVSSG